MRRAGATEVARSGGALGIAGALLVLTVAVVLCYASSLGAPLLFDDRGTILENPTIRSLDPPWLPLWTPPDRTATGRPVFNLSLALSYAFGGSQPKAHHVGNLAVHVLAAWTLFGVARRTLCQDSLRDRFGRHATLLAWGCALIWALHPLHTQAVTYLSQRCESLMGLFVLLTLYCAIRGWQASRGARWQIAAVVSAVLGAGAKETAALAPLLVLAYDRTFVHATLPQALRSSRPFYVALLLAPALTAWLLIANGQARQALEPAAFGWLEYARSQPAVILRYLGLAFWPDPLIFDYDWPISPWRDALPHILVIGGLLCASIGALLRRSAAGFLGAAFFLLLAPTSSVLPMRFLAFEYRMYLPLIPVVALVLLGAYRLGGRLLERHAQEGSGEGWTLAVATAALVIVATVSLGAATVRRNQDYRSEVALWEDTARKRPRNPRAHINIGRALVDAGQPERALPHFEEAVRLAPEDAIAQLNLGGSFDLAGKLAEAQQRYERALALRPDFAEAHNNLAGILAARGETEAALRHHEEALRLAPGFAGAHYNLGRTLLGLGRRREAAEQLREALRLDPGLDRARALLERTGGGARAADATP